jgi:CRP-like cAMP-binding protein
MESLRSETTRLGPRWVSRVVEALQPAQRAHRLGSIRLFAGLEWSDLEFAARCLTETTVERGTRMTVQGKPSSRLWLIMQGEALVSADARPIRVAGHGDVIGGMTLINQLEAPETTIALTPIRAFEAGPEQFRNLIRHRSIRRRLAAIHSLPRPGRRRSSARE